MRFYFFEGNLKKKIEIYSYDERNEFRKDICINSEKFNEQFGDKAFFFLEYYNETDASVGVFLRRQRRLLKQLGLSLILRSHTRSPLSLFCKSSDHPIAVISFMILKKYWISLDLAL